MQCKSHNPATYYRYNILDRRDWKFIPPPPLSPQLRIGKQHALAFAQLHPRVFFCGGGGGARDGWLALPFYSVQDCSQDYLWDGL